MGRSVQFRVLGPLEVWVAGVRVEVGPARLRAVLGVLLVEPDSVITVEQLVDRVWGENPPPGARNTLYSYLSRLRALLGGVGGPALVRHSGGYALDVDPMLVDLHRFRALAAEARQATKDTVAAERWEEALLLWRGEPFADLDVPWLRTVATGLGAERLEALLDRNDLLLRCGEHSRLPAELAEVASVHTLDERVAAQMMLALYRCGRQGDALAQFQQVRQRLAEELGCDPGEPLQQLYEQILRQDPSLQPLPTVRPAPSALPADGAGFVGRAVQLRQLATPLVESTSTAAVVVISGSAGIGKTALAVHWAHRIRDRFPDGQLYLNLRGFDPAGTTMSTAEALRVLLELLGVPLARIPASVDALAGLYRDRLAGRRILVVLDNARDTAQVSPLLPGAPGCLVVVTSRHQLAGLVAGSGARPVTLDVLSDEEGRQLLAHRLGPDRLSAEPAAAAQIVAACAGLPLALAIVAALITLRPWLPLDRVAAALADARLDALAGPDPSTNLRAVFSWSYNCLTPSAARLFRLLGLHPGPDIGLPAVAGLAGEPTGQVRQSLAELVYAHLVTEHHPDRYAMHDLLRAYAADLAQTEPERDEATGRLLDHYAYTARAAALLLSPQRRALQAAPPRPGACPEELAVPAHALAWFRVEQPVLVAAVSLAARIGWDAYVWDLAWAITDDLDRNGRWLDQIELQREALAAARRHGDPARLAVSHRLLGKAYAQVGRVADSRSHLREALAGYAALGDRLGQAYTYFGLGRTFERERAYEEALASVDKALCLFRRVGHPFGEADSLNAIGWLYAQRGEYGRTLHHCRRALVLHRRVGYRLGEADTLDSLGYAYQRLGRHGQAVDCYQQSIDLARQIGNRHIEAWSLAGLGDAHAAAGSVDRARDAWQRSLSILDDIDHPEAGRLRERLR